MKTQFNPKEKELLKAIMTDRKEATRLLYRDKQRQAEIDLTSCRIEGCDNPVALNRNGCCLDCFEMTSN